MTLRRPQQQTAGKTATRKGRNELTEEQRQEIKEAFDLFDTDGSGLNFKSFSNLLTFPFRQN